MIFATNMIGTFRSLMVALSSWLLLKDREGFHTAVPAYQVHVEHLLGFASPELAGWVGPTNSIDSA